MVIVASGLGLNSLLGAGDMALLKNSVLQDVVQAERAQIREDEGYKNHAYVDTLGYKTAGIGHLLSEKEIGEFPPQAWVPDKNNDIKGIKYSEEQIKKWFEDQTKAATKSAKALVGEDVPPEVFGILVNMSFNMGQAKVKKFKGMIKAIKKGDYERAAQEMEFTNPDKDRSEKGWTPWRTQTGDRAQRLIDRMRVVGVADQELARAGPRSTMYAPPSGLLNYVA